MALTTTQNHEQKAMTSSTVTTLSIPPNGKIQSLGLLFLTSGGAPVTEAQIRAEIGNIRLTINGQDIINVSAVQLLDIYEQIAVRVGIPAGVGGAVELNIGRLLYADPVVRDVFGFGTADVSSIQVQVTAGTLSAIASVQAITERQNVSQNLGLHIRLNNYVISFNSTGDNTLDTLPRDQNSGYLAVFIDDGSAGTITFSEVRIGSLTIRERLSSAMNTLFNSNKGFSQISGYYSHFFADGGLSGVLPMEGVTDLRFITTFSVAPGAAGYNVAVMKMVQQGANVLNVGAYLNGIAGR